MIGPPADLAVDVESVALEESFFAAYTAAEEIKWNTIRSAGRK
jgi:hypothetical protein